MLENWLRGRKNGEVGTGVFWVYLSIFPAGGETCAPKLSWVLHPITGQDSTILILS